MPRKSRPPIPQEAALLSPGEAAQFLGVGKTTLSRWRDEVPPRIPFTAHSSRVIRYRLADLLNAQTQQEIP
jgi:hypothetical protein